MKKKSSSERGGVLDGLHSEQLCETIEYTPTEIDLYHEAITEQAEFETEMARTRHGHAERVRVARDNLFKFISKRGADITNRQVALKTTDNSAVYLIHGSVITNIHLLEDTDQLEA